jgi:hypothetical protein
MDTTGMDVIRLMQLEAELGAVAPIPQQRRPVDPVLFQSDDEAADGGQEEGE